MTDTDAQQSETAPPVILCLWNPTAAANWCLLFTPIFGALVHAKNWERMGQPVWARHQLRWAIAGVAMVILSSTASIAGLLLHVSKAVEGTVTNVAFAANMIFLLVWYLMTARPQIEYVAAGLGGKYQKLPWGKLLLHAAWWMTGYVAISLALTMLLVALRTPAATP